MLSTALGSKEYGGRVRGVSSKLTFRDWFQEDRSTYKRHDRYKEEMIQAAEQAAESKFREMFAQIVEHQSGQIVTMPPPVLAQSNSTCAQSSVASTTAQPYPVDSVTSNTPCLLLYPIGRAGKTKEVAKAHVDPAGALFEGKPISPLYACVRVQELLKSSYQDNEIDIPTADGKTTLGQCVGITIQWHKRDIILLVSPDLTTPSPQ